MLRKVVETQVTGVRRYLKNARICGFCPEDPESGLWGSLFVVRRVLSGLSVSGKILLGVRKIKLMTVRESGLTAGKVGN